VCGDTTLRLVRLMHLDEVMDVVTEPGDASNGSVTSADVQPSDPG
jgi:anti-sigma B factor antagonist